MIYQIAVHGKSNPDYYHFLDAQALVNWLVDRGDSIMEVTVREV